MKTVFLLLAAAAMAGGCTVVPSTEFNACKAENRSLSDQNRAQLAEIENLRVHARDLEDRVIRSEKRLATLQERSGLDKNQLAAYEQERSGLYDQFKALASGRNRLPPQVSQQLVELTKRHPNLQFDPSTGVTKLDTDILFDSGDAVLKPGAGQLIDDLVVVLSSKAASNLKVMVAGHTDGQQIVGPETREKFRDNFHLSAARALAVADRMKRAGLSDQQVAVAGFGPCQPIASNTSVQDRQKNRRVEIFLIAPETPVVGWSESTPSVYDSGVRR